MQDFNLFYVTRYGFRPSKIAYLAHHAWSDVAAELAGEHRPPMATRLSCTRDQALARSLSLSLLCDQSVQTFRATERTEDFLRRLALTARRLARAVGWQCASMDRRAVCQCALGFRRPMHHSRARSRMSFVAAAKKLRQWLFEAALPLWWRVGADHALGGYHERIDFNGRPGDIAKALARRRPASLLLLRSGPARMERTVARGRPVMRSIFCATDLRRTTAP